jgi:MYXO-CTERM domain-containing protein
LTFVTPHDGDVVEPEVEIEVKVTYDDQSDVGAVTLLVDGEMPPEFPGCEPSPFCGVTTTLSPGIHTLTAITHPDNDAEMLSVSISVEVTDEADDAQGCRTGRPDLSGWLLLLVAGAWVRRRRA